MESYTVVIRSGSTSNSRISGDNTDGTYYVEWNNVLPKKYKRFELHSYFRNTPKTDLTTTDDDFVCVECSAFPKHNFYDSLRCQNSNFICMAPTYYLATINNDAYLYNESNASNMPSVMVEYPVENQFVIKLTDLTGNILTSTRYIEWVLIMNFRPIENNE